MQYVSAQIGHFLQSRSLQLFQSTHYLIAFTFSEYPILRKETRRKREREREGQAFNFVV